MLTTDKGDNALLDDYARHGIEESFDELVRRHGALVFGVCCRVLGQTQDAEDAAQAVFLTLANKAKSLRHQRSIAGWLHHVAWNVSLCARKAAQKRKHREQEAAVMPTHTTTDEWEHVKPLLDAELAALPEKYRLPLILHHVEGQTQEQIAALVGCTYGTLSSRLSHAREMLRERLVRRGVTLAPALIFLLMSRHAGTAMPAALAASTVRAAGLLRSGDHAAQAQISSRVQEISQFAARAALLGRLKVAACAMAAVILIGSSTALLVQARNSRAAVVATPTAGSNEHPAALKDPHTEGRAPAPIAPAPAAAQIDPQVAGWIAQLGSDDAEIRSGAMNQLRAAGSKAEIALKEATEKLAGEARQRAAVLLGVLGTAGELQKIGEAGRKLGNFEADEENTRLVGGAQVSSSTHFKVMPEKGRYRADSETNAGVVKMKVTLVCDGKVEWSEMETPMGKRPMKSKATGLCEHHFSLNLDDYRGMYDFTSVREETAGGIAVYVFSGVMRDDYAQGRRAAVRLQLIDDDKYEAMRTCTATVSKIDLLLTNLEWKDDQGVVTMTSTFKNVKKNVAMNETQFVYPPPTGVDVWDMDELRTPEKKEPAVQGEGKKEDF